MLLAMAVGLAIFQWSCLGKKNDQARDFDPEAIYLDYNVWGDEESGMVTVKLQFRYGGPEGFPIALDNPAKVEFDGEQMKADSSKMNGSWYELNKSIRDFIGNHQIVYTDGDEQVYREEFNFSRFYLNEDMPRSIKRDDLTFELTGLDSGSYIRLLLSDTSFYGPGIDRLDTIRNGKVNILKRDLDKLENGPVFLEFYLEKEKPLAQTTRRGGMLSTTYSLKRVFELRD